VQGDCQWGKDGERRISQPRQQTFFPQAVHTFCGVSDQWVTVHIPEDSTVLIFLLHCGDREIGCGCYHSVKQKTMC
jgi:hypothetical protein